MRQTVNVIDCRAIRCSGGCAIIGLHHPGLRRRTPMSVTELVSHYGYFAVAMGCLLEGETVLLTAGFAAHRGMLGLWPVLGIAFVASALGDQIFFQLGRHQGLA